MEVCYDGVLGKNLLRSDSNLLVTLVGTNLSAERDEVRISTSSSLSPAAPCLLFSTSPLAMFAGDVVDTEVFLFRSRPSWGICCVDCSDIRRWWP